MKIHKAGYSVIGVTVLMVVIVMSLLIGLKANTVAIYVVGIMLGLLLLFVLRFFRFPNRKIEFTENQVICPADGKIVVIEEIEEDQFIKEKRIQVSIFMSVWSVHINWYPIVGKVLESLHFDGRYMAAWLPKSSFENERSVVVMENSKGQKILIKQIAGAVARRIITYGKKNDAVKQGDQLGFIRFGSRVDVLLPLNYDINVQLGDMVTGGITLLAEEKK